MMMFNESKRVRRPAQYDELLNKLVREDKIFSGLKNALIFAASVGFQKQLRVSFDKSSDPIRLSIFDMELDIPFLLSLAIAEVESISVMKAESLEEVVLIFEEYANGGLSYISSIYDSASDVQTLEQLVMEGDKQEDFSDIFDDF